MYKAFLIKYGEIGVKGKNRYLFEDALVRQIRFALNKIDGDFVVSKENGRIYATAQSEFDYDEAVEALKTVFGIIGICPVVQIEDNGFDDLAEHVIKYLDEAYPDKNVTFKVDARRARKNYPMNSMEINMEMGGRILDAFPEMKVDVHKPEVLLQIEIRKNINIYSIEIPGPGGMPIGTAGKAMLLLSGGIDSPVAGYMMAKRGLIVDGIHFVSPPYTSERALMKVETLCEKLTSYCGDIRFYCVPFTEIQEALRDNCPEEFFTIIMRRLMVKIANIIAERNEYGALVTGESVGQVASQTLKAIQCTDAAAEYPVFRPVIGMDKKEIIDIARKIDTFETSTLPYEDCCTVFTPKHPKTRPVFDEVIKAEQSFDFAPLIEKAVEGTTVKLFRIESKEEQE